MKALLGNKTAGVNLLRRRNGWYMVRDTKVVRNFHPNYFRGLSPVTDIPFRAWIDSCM